MPQKTKHRPSIERTETWRRWVHVNSIIPNNLRVCHVTDKHGGQFSGGGWGGNQKRQTERESCAGEKSCRWLLRRSAIKTSIDAAEGTAAVHLITFIHLPRETYASFVFSVLQARCEEVLRSPCSSVGIFDRKNSPEPRNTSHPVFAFLSLSLHFLLPLLFTRVIDNTRPDELTGHKLTGIKRVIRVYCCSGRGTALKGIYASLAISG